MRSTYEIAVCLLAAVLTQQLAVGGEQSAPATADSPGTLRSLTPPPILGEGMTFNGFAQYRLSPDLGAPGTGANGHLHFSQRMHNYTHWYRPRAATLNQCQRCLPDPFRPRGFGRLFNRPCDGYRMEYSPYMMSESTSAYGPSYISRKPDPRCKDGDSFLP